MNNCEKTKKFICDLFKNGCPFETILENIIKLGANPVDILIFMIDNDYDLTEDIVDFFEKNFDNNHNIDKNNLLPGTEKYNIHNNIGDMLNDINYIDEETFNRTNDIIDNYENKISNLEKELADTKKEFDSHLSFYDKKICEYDGIINILKEEKKDISKILENITNEKQELEKLLKDILNQDKKNDSDINQFIDECQTKLKEKENLISILNEENDEMCKKLIENDSKVIELKSLIEKEKLKLQEKEEYYNDKIRFIVETNKNISNEEMEKLQNKIYDLEFEIVGLQGDFSRITAKYDKLAETFSKIKEENEMLKNKVKKYKYENIDSVKDELNYYYALVAAQQEEIEKYKKSESEHSIIKSHLSMYKEAYEKEMNNHQKSCEKYERESDKYEEHILNLKNTIKSKDMEIEAYKSDVEDNELVIEEQRVIYKKAEKYVIEYRDQINMLENILEEKDNVINLKENLIQEKDLIIKNKDLIIEEKDSIINNQNTIIEGDNKLIKGRNGIISKYSQSIEDLNNKNYTQSKLIDELRLEIKDLRDKIKALEDEDISKFEIENYL